MEISISTPERSSSFLFLYLLALSAFQFQLGSPSRFSPIFPNQTVSPLALNRSSNIILPLSGEVYELSYFTAPLSIGQPPMNFDLAIDTGSDLTWVRCDEKAVNQLYYKPNKENYVRCDDPFCKPYREGRPCRRPDDKCPYRTNYADKYRSSGFLVADKFTLHSTNGKTIVIPRLVFGCDTTKPKTAGMIGLMNKEISILSQLHKAGIIKNVVGHCLDSKGGGFMFLGDVPRSSSITWVPRNPKSLKEFYSPEPASLLHDGKPIGGAASAKNLQLIFDCGATYIVLSPTLYDTVLNQIQEDLKAKKLQTIKPDPKVDKTPFKICWHRPGKIFKSFADVKTYFKPMLLSFPNNKQLQLPPEAYLIIARDGDVCLGIFKKKPGTGKGNTVGDVSMQDRMMIFDNENQRIGWVSADCAKIPKS